MMEKNCGKLRGNRDNKNVECKKNTAYNKEIKKL